MSFLSTLTCQIHFVQVCVFNSEDTVQGKMLFHWSYCLLQVGVNPELTVILVLNILHLLTVQKCAGS